MIYSNAGAIELRIRLVVLVSVIFSDCMPVYLPAKGDKVDLNKMQVFTVPLNLLTSFTVKTLKDL